jgi:outer membrane protein OmpA-like peptidoglycan-associated protein
MKKIFCFILLLSFSQALTPEVFKFKYLPNSKQRIEGFINGKQLQNQKVVAEYSQQYKTVRTVKALESGAALLEDNYYFYNKNKLANDRIMELRDEETVYYKADEAGRITISKYSVFPTMRNAPVFPEQNVKPGESWNAPATEAQDLFSDKSISTFPVNVKYTFIGYEKLNGRDVAKIKYEYDLEITNNGQKDIDKRIKKVLGKSVTMMYFDYKNGARLKEEYSRDYGFLINTGAQETVVEFIDNGVRYWYDIELMNKDKIADELKKSFEKENIKDATVNKDEKGVKISLENIHFKPDSTELLSEENARLNKIASILKKYKDKGILVIGHTTDKGDAAAKLKLSIDRAKSIADFLIDKDAINVLKSSFGGKGDTEPVAENNTDEGMKKNRRVEIFILEE